MTFLPIPEDVEEFRALVRGWLDEHLVGEFAEHLGAGGVDDTEDWDVRVRWDHELAAAGLLALSWPVEYGGRDAPLYHEVVLNEELSAARAPYRAGVHGLELFGPTLLMFGSDEQKRRFLPPIAAGKQFWGQGFSEPEAGSDLASLRTRARLDGDEWVIDGQKIWTSAGVYADWFYVMCRTNLDAPRHKGISMLLVPADQPGIEVRPIRNILGGSEFCEVFFSGARTSASMLVGEVDQGWRVAMGALGTERGTTLLAEHLRIQHEVDAMIDAARSTAQSGSAVMRANLVRAWSEARIIEWNGRRLMSALKGRDGDPAAQASVSKVFASTAHQRMAELGVRARGAGGEVVGDGYRLDRLQQVMLATRAESIYGGTTQIQLNLLAERTLGLPREPRPS
jgi:alkylation response protein AidB-like acyl-CoA dehydrogenase